MATPLGHLGDVSFRALEVLRSVALVACEDTRRTAYLLSAHGITANDLLLRTQRALEGGADPGGVAPRGGRRARLRCGNARSLGSRIPPHPRRTGRGLPVLPVPGPSALVAALSVSGLPTDRFFFVGFLPSRTSARRRALEDLAAITATLVFYESPVRILAALSDMAAAFGDRDAFLAVR